MRLSAEERYLVACNSSDLRVLSERKTDADSLVAAAYATRGDGRRSLALRVQRLRGSARMEGAQQIADELGRMLRRSIPSRPAQSHTRLALPRVVAIDMATIVLKWWHNKTCPKCLGRKHPLIEGTPVLNEAIHCEACGGTGELPLSKVIAPEFLVHAEWLVSEIEGLSSMIFNDMSRGMRGSE